MDAIETFNHLSAEYDRWFDENRESYEAELRAVSELVRPCGLNGLEVGVGTGRFAGPLGIGTGIDPSVGMTSRAVDSGVRIVGGVAEALPFGDGAFDFVLMVTVLCFLADVKQVFREAFRVIRPGGFLVVAFIDRDSEMGQVYEQKKSGSRFYRSAQFCSGEDVLDYMRRAGFSDFETKQTLFPGNNGHHVEPGFGQGGFVVVKGKKPLIREMLPLSGKKKYKIM